jgi:hypothetical protein
MSEENLVQLRLQNGVYEGILTSPVMPELELVQGGAVIAVARVVPDADRPGCYRVTADLPSTVLSEGVQVVSFRSTHNGDILARLTFMSGSLLDEDIRAEVALLRDELEMLKRAFRQHCVATNGD